MSENRSSLVELKPLAIACTSNDCANGLHCFRQSRKMREANQGGRCRACGIELVDWDRVHKRDLTDIGHTFEALKYEFIRHHYWHVDIDQRAINHALRKGSVKMKAATENRLRKSGRE